MPGPPCPLPRQLLKHRPGPCCTTSAGGRTAAAAGFTLVELLVAVVIIGLLLALVVAGLGAARVAAQRTTCLNNLRELGLATQIYVNTHNKYPRAWVGDNRRWMDLLKPYLEKRCAVYQCPNDPKKVPCTWDPEIVLSYGINCFKFQDQAHCFWYWVDAGDVRYPSRVILYADCTPGKYYCGGGSKFKEPVVDVDYRHMNGTFNAVYCDGHAETKTATTQEEWDAAQ